MRTQENENQNDYEDFTAYSKLKSSQKSSIDKLILNDDDETPHILDNEDHNYLNKLISAPSNDLGSMTFEQDESKNTES